MLEKIDNNLTPESLTKVWPLIILSGVFSLVISLPFWKLMSSCCALTFSFFFFYCHTFTHHFSHSCLMRSCWETVYLKSCGSDCVKTMFFLKLLFDLKDIKVKKKKL